MTHNTHNRIHDWVTAAIVERLEQGVVPWSKPWVGGAGGRPANLISGKDYRGTNLLLLACTGSWASRYFLTFKQAQKLGGTVNKGERGSLVVYYQLLKSSKLDDDGNRIGKRFPFLKYYKVFNLSQCAGVTHKRLIEEQTTKPEPRTRHEIIASCEDTWSNFKDRPTVIHGGGRASYSPSSDGISMPPAASFIDSPAYYSTLFHEGVHSTGHRSRLARLAVANGHGGFGTGAYSREELVAEMGAAMLAAHCDIFDVTADNSASYCASWIKALKADPTAVVKASSAAQKASDYILGEPPPSYDD